MFIVYDKSIDSLVFSNSDRGFEIVYRISDGESNNSIDYVLENNTIRYIPQNENALNYYKRMHNKDALRHLVVNYKGVDYKANDESTSRMLSNIAVMSDDELIPWKSYNGSITPLTKEELTDIVRLANAERTRLVVE